MQVNRYGQIRHDGNSEYFQYGSGHQAVKRFAVLALTLSVALGACGRAPQEVDLSAVGTVVFEAGEREPAPALRGPSLATGNDLAVGPGQLTVLNSWASWCAPCLTEMPMLIDAAANHPGVRFIGLNAIDDEVQASQFVEDLGITFDSIRDPEGELLATIPGVPPRALPSTVVLDSQGRIAARIIGPIKEGQLDTILDDLIAEDR
jgi:thiol-disulfide isomerase/thioredoxin